MEDHHVDRPDVEARRRVKLTGTNRSFDLIALVAKARLHFIESAKALSVKRRAMARAGFALAYPCGMREQDPSNPTENPSFASSVLCRPGGSCKVIRPDPIPNSAVKRLSADGTLSQDMGE